MFTINDLASDGLALGVFIGAIIGFCAVAIPLFVVYYVIPNMQQGEEQARQRASERQQWREERIAEAQKRGRGVSMETGGSHSANPFQKEGDWSYQMIPFDDGFDQDGN